MELKVKELVLKGKITKQTEEIYSKLGLEIESSSEMIKIKSTISSTIKGVNHAIHIELNALSVLNRVIEEGFCRYSEENSMPLEMMDDLGNKIFVYFNPKKSVKRIAILTSGGDSPGMNSAIRAAVRTAMKWGSTVYGVYSGYEGLIKDNIEEFMWNDVEGHNASGGTFLYSARSKSFFTSEGRRRAVYNLAKRGIEGLIVLGGDGSLRGASIFQREFKDHLRELIKSGELTCCVYNIRIVCIPASIDNDIPFADTIIGADTALHRVVECLDNLMTTMESHCRSFVVEVMGRKCGFIALMSSIATGADFLFIPESPVFEWKKSLIRSIKRARELGKRGIFVILAEGAVDINGNQILPNAVKQLIIEETQIETRILTLGHLQRGGTPSAHDRILATISGCKAVECLFTNDEETPLLVCINNGEYKVIELEKIIRKAEEISRLQDARKYDLIKESRGIFFNRCHQYSESYCMTTTSTAKIKKRIAIIHHGSIASGVNTAVDAFVHYGKICDLDVLVISDGFSGLVNDQVTRPKFYDYKSEMKKSGSIIGSTSDFFDLKLIVQKIKQHNIEALIVLGDEKSMIRISEIADATNIDVILIPSSIANNIPGTDISIGSDTALNTITKSCDLLKSSSSSISRCIFVVEVQGGNCGYLALMSGIAAGAFESFIPERRYMIGHLSEIAQRLRIKFNQGQKQGTLLLRNENTFEKITTDAFSKLIMTDSDGLFKTKYCVLGHLQRGDIPSPIDRINSTILAIKAIDILTENDSENIVTSKNIIGVIGVQGQRIIFTEIRDIMKCFDEKNMRDKKPKWLEYSGICRSIE
ncbi:ATP-dependent 6-phosphofructokinase, liver type [Dictyocoela muelleri]|nr:ATP-dependent 6-phosphofructokinase, liver type [Dictyocoela muelleri]